MGFFKNFCPVTVEIDGHRVECKSSTYELHTHRGSFVGDDSIRYDVEWFDYTSFVLMKEN